VPVEIVQFPMKLSLKQIILAVHYDFHWLAVDSHTSFTLC